MEVDIVGVCRNTAQQRLKHVTAGHAQCRANQAQRNHKDNRQRDRPAFVQSSQYQEYSGSGQCVQHNSLRAAFSLFTRLTAPFQTVTAAHFINHLLYRSHGLTGRYAINRRAGKLHCRITIEADALFHTVFPRNSSNGRKRYGHAGFVRYSQVQNIGRLHTGTRISLYHYALQTALIREVVDIRRTQRRSQSSTDIRERNTLCGCCRAVDVDFQLRRIFQTARTNGTWVKQTAFTHFVNQLIAFGQQCSMAAVVTVLQVNRQAGACTQFHNGRRHNRQTETVFQRSHHHTGQLTGNRSRIAARSSTFAPVFQNDKAQSHVLAGTAKTKAGNGNNVLDLRYRFRQLGDLSQSCIGTFFGRTGRQLYAQHQVTLVFCRQEGSRQTHKQEYAHNSQTNIDNHHA